MRAAILVTAATLALGVACYRTTDPQPVGSTRLTSADEGDTDSLAKDAGANQHPYDSDYDHPGQSTGIRPPSSIPPTPVGRPAPWRGSSGGGSK